MSQDDKDIIKKYIKAAMVRSSLAYKTMKQNSLLRNYFLSKRTMMHFHISE